MTPAVNVAGKVIAITGAAAGGIGFATAELLAQRGAHLSLADVQADALAAAAATIRARNPAVTIITAAVDVRDRAQVEAWIARTVAELGGLDGAANAAGTTGAYGRVMDVEDDAWDFAMDVNCRGTLNCLRAQLSAMKDGGGAIVNVASVAGMLSAATASPYGASKAAVVSLTRSAARESGAQNVRVNAICPGVIDTPLSRESERALGHPLPTKYQCLNRKGEAREVAALIAFLLSDDATFITGATIPVDGGFLA